MSARLIDQLVDGFHRRPESRRVKRALFGPVDHEENYRFVQRELARNREEASKRWNYDFGRDAPLPGRYQWESAASVVVKQPLKDTCDNKSSSHQRPSRNAKKQQTHMTDYLQHRKRSKSKVKVQERKPSSESSSSSSQQKESSPSQPVSSEETTTVSA